jgi:hypothetical protein
MVERKKARELIRNAKSSGRNLLEHEALWLLDEYGFPLPPFRILHHDRHSPIELPAGLPYPLVVKAISAQIIHKSEAGAVRLNIDSKDGLAEAIRGMERAIRERVPEAVIEGWLVRPFLPEGTEIIAGSIVDPQFGPAVMVGIGGVFTEVFRDVSFRLAPLSAVDAEEMIGELKGQAMLDGIRSRSPVPRARLAEILVRLGNLVEDNPDIEECDLNPIICRAERLDVADARVKIRMGS